MSIVTTPAIERAQAVMDLAESRRRMGPHRCAPATAYSVLDAALDVEEMARAMYSGMVATTPGPLLPPWGKAPERTKARLLGLAADIRASILGGAR